MKTQVEGKLILISEIWNNFIWNYRYCSSQIKFNGDAQTNFFGDILGYFEDTLDIIFESERVKTNKNEKFSYAISFLQAIYIQQDFIEELLTLFKTTIDKGDLINDELYTINRLIRNEFIGHPIRRVNGQFISSTLFNYQTNSNEIGYAIYHRENNFEFNIQTHLIEVIQERHILFLEKYLDIIILKLHEILLDYQNKLESLQKVIDKKDIKTILKLAELYFESIFESSFLFNKESIINIFLRTTEHNRYLKFIDKFLYELKSEVNFKIDWIVELDKKRKKREEVSDRKNEKHSSPKKNSKKKQMLIKTKHRECDSYNYVIQKLTTNRTQENFEFYSQILVNNMPDNDLIQIEINHMKRNLQDDIEYYTSLHLIHLELNKSLMV